MEKKIVHYSSDEAAHQETVTGWVSRIGHFFGKDEHMARWDGCTHVACSKCGEPVDKGWTACKKCRDTSEAERFQKKERKQWDGKTPLCLYNLDQYFWDADDLDQYCDEHDCKPADLPLMICEPVHAHEIDPSEYYHDELPEDGNGELPDELEAAFKELNERIRECKHPLCWREGSYVAILSS